MGERHEVGARQRPNTGEIQRGRVPLSSSAATGGASGRLGSDWAIVALLDRSTTGRATKTAASRPRRPPVRKPRL